jgi:membrane protease subunit (stomatin/prohibitin family)
VRLRAFGTYGLKVSDPAAFIRQFVGTDQRFTIEELGDQLRDLIIARFADILGESKIPVLDMAANQDELGKFVTDRIHDDFGQFGLQVVAFTVENISLPPEVEAAMDKRTSMGVIGNLNAYTQYQAANALGDAAKNPAGGLAAGGIGAGMGFAMGTQMGQAMSQQNAQVGPATPPPMPTSTTYYVAMNNQQAGPFPMDRLQELIKAGQLGRQTLVWKAGMPQWMAAEKVIELSPLFVEVPPPLPNG